MATKVGWSLLRSVTLAFGYIALCCFVPRASCSAAEPRIQSKVTEAYENLPLSFEPNRGQVSPHVQFLSRGAGYSVYLSPGEAELHLNPSEPTGRNVRLKFQLQGANKGGGIRGESPLPGHSNYLFGSDSSQWLSDVPQYRLARMDRIYPGIDLAYYGNKQRLEYDFIVSAGADAGRIKFRIVGAERLHVDSRGSLIIHTKNGDVAWERPIAYQEQGGKRHTVTSKYRISGDLISFALGKYDRNVPLVIDPVLAYATFLGGSGIGDRAFAVALDPAGNAYVIGTTNSLDLSTSPNALQHNFGNDGIGSQAFITKLDPLGGSVLYSSYLGGNGSEFGYDIAIDSSGNAYALLQTTSTNLPIVNGFQSANSGGMDAYLAKLSTSGNQLLYSSYMGGNNNEQPAGLALDSGNNVYISGQSKSTNWSATPGAYSQSFFFGSPSRVFDEDSFVLKVNPSLSGPASLRYLTFLGSNRDAAFAVAVDQSGEAVVTGEAEVFPLCSGKGCFPITPGAYNQVPTNGGFLAFVTKLNAAGSGLIYSSAFGGSNTQFGTAIAIDDGGNAYIGGATRAQDFPTTPGVYQTTNNSFNFIGFLSKLDPAGSTLLASTYLGGGDTVWIGKMALDSGANIVAGGYTLDLNFPTTPDAIQSHGGAFASKLSPDLRSLIFSTTLGAAGDQAWGIAVGPSDDIFIVGNTFSPSFPVQPGSYQTKFMPQERGFAARISLGDPPTCTAAPDAPDPSVTLCTPGNNSLVNSQVRVAAFSKSSNPVASTEILIDSQVVFTSTNHAETDAIVTVPSGNHSLTVQSTDSVGHVFSRTSEILVNFPSAPLGGSCAPPSGDGVNVCQPADGAKLNSPVHVLATASSSAGRITALRVYVDNRDEFTFFTNNGPDTTQNNTIDMNLNLANGTHRVVIVAWNQFGAAFVSPTSKITVGPPQGACPVPTGAPYPSVTVCAPLDGASVMSPVHFLAGTRSYYPVSAVQIYVNGKLAYSKNTTQLDTSLQLSAGTYAIEIKGWDTSGASFSKTETITVH